MKNTTNAFLKGMTSDMHPLTTSQLEYTDALNATLITFNGNEQMMQNDMGNTRIQDAKTGNIMGLREGFVPVGMEEHGGIMYIASVNKEGKGEVGTIPSPVITYKPLDDKPGEAINFAWAKKEDESKVFSLYEDEINPEEVFIIGIDNPSDKGISSLTEKRLYVPHLIATNSKGEKEITPTNKAMVGENNYWFKQLSNFETDLISINALVEQLASKLNPIEQVNFLSYPKIPSGKLGIKFTKENISEFRLAPNGAHNKQEEDVRCYPVTYYDLPDPANPDSIKYHSMLYGVQYKTDSDVKIDKFQITYQVEGEDEVVLPIYRVVKGASTGEYVKEYNPEDCDKCYGWITLTKSIGNKSFGPSNWWPATTSIIAGQAVAFDSTHLLNPNSQIVEGQPKSEIIKETEIVATRSIKRSTNTPDTNDIKSYALYDIPLENTNNKWITLKITYWREGWDNPLGTYTMDYNPYYMDNLGLFVVKRYWKVHEFENGKSSFWLYTDYNKYNLNGQNLVELKSIKDSRDAIEISQAERTGNMLDDFLFDFVNTDENEFTEVTELGKPFRFFTLYKFNISDLLKDVNKYPNTTTYLRSKPSLDGNYNTNKIEFKGVSFNVNFAASSSESKLKNNPHNDNPQDCAVLVNCNWSLRNSAYNGTLIGDDLQDSGQPQSKEGLWLIGSSSDGTTVFALQDGKWTNINEVKEYKMNFTIPCSLSYERECNTINGNDIYLNISVDTLRTKNILKYYKNRNSLYVSISNPVLTFKLNEFDYKVTIPNKSSYKVTPQVDAIVNILDEHNNEIPYPAYVKFENGLPKELYKTCIDYSKNYITLSGDFISTDTVDGRWTGYSTHPKPNPEIQTQVPTIQSSFTLENIEQYRPNITIKPLDPDKLYIFYLQNDDLDDKYKIKVKNKDESKEILNGCFIIAPTTVYNEIEITKVFIDKKGFRTIGIYELLGKVTGITDEQKENIFIDITDDMTVNGQPLKDSIYQTVFCYAEDSFSLEERYIFGDLKNQKSYSECYITKQTPWYNHNEIIKNNEIIYDDENPVNPYKYKCIPIAEYAYLNKIEVYEKDTSGTYWDGENQININEVLKDENGNVIKFRNVPEYTGEYSLSASDNVKWGKESN